jgi:hypothetical protein
MESNKIIYILFAITLIWLLFLTGRGTGYSVVSGGDYSSYLLNNTTGEVWNLVVNKKIKVE